MKKHKKNKGFTLLEILLTIAVLLIIVAISVPVSITFQLKNDLNIAEISIAQSLRRAQLLAQSSDADTDWGVKIETGSITIFKGSNFASRDINFDEVFDFSLSITPSGFTEIVFSKFYGAPQSIGTTTLSSSINETREIFINEKGIVDY